MMSWSDRCPLPLGPEPFPFGPVPLPLAPAPFPSPFCVPKFDVIEPSVWDFPGLFSAVSAARGTTSN